MSPPFRMHLQSFHIRWPTLDRGPLIAFPFLQSGTALKDGDRSIGSFSGGVNVNGHRSTIRRLDTASYLAGTRDFLSSRSRSALPQSPPALIADLQYLGRLVHVSIFTFHVLRHTFSHGLPICFTTQMVKPCSITSPHNSRSHVPSLNHTYTAPGDLKSA